MYTTCIFCQSDLGRNEAIEEFPVGRRLAFDGGRGRLWVVCRRCERWNLSPLDTRWEAIEACERAFETTRMRVASDNIGLAKLKEGLELVRVGDPVRQEFAAWRYGDQFGRRRRRAALITGAVGAAAGGVVVGGTLAGFAMGGMFPGSFRRLRPGIGTASSSVSGTRVEIRSGSSESTSIPPVSCRARTPRDGISASITSRVGTSGGRPTSARTGGTR